MVNEPPIREQYAVFEGTDMTRIDLVLRTSLSLALMTSGVQSAFAQDAATPAPVAAPAADDRPTTTNSTAPAREPDLIDQLHGGSGGLTADQVAALAETTAPSVARAEAALMSARAGAARALIGVFPIIDLSARYSRLSTVPTPTIGNTLTADQVAAAQMVINSVTDPAARQLFSADLAAAQASSFSFPVVLDQYVLHAGLTWPVSDIFFSILPTYHAMESLADSSAEQLNAQHQTVALQAREAFYSYARAKAASLVAELAVRQAEAHRADIAAFVEAGTAAPVDLMRLDAQVAAARVAFARASGGVATAAVAVRSLMHADPNVELTIGENLLADAAPVTQTREQLVNAAMEHRAEMRGLRRLVAAREHLVNARTGQRLPHLALTANADYANPNSRIFPARAEFHGTWDVSAILSWSPNALFTYGQDQNVAEADLAQAQADLAALEDGLRLEVSQAYEGYVASREALLSARAGVAAAEESYRVRLERFHAGAAVTSELLDADSELSRSRLDLINAAVDLRIAEARVRRASGESVSATQ